MSELNDIIYGVHPTASAPGSQSQPAISASSVNSGVSERRRLSIIFHRPSAGGDLAGPPTIHGSNCQSPRTQRCWRAAATA